MGGGTPMKTSLVTSRPFARAALTTGLLTWVLVAPLAWADGGGGSAAPARRCHRRRLPKRAEQRGPRSTVRLSEPLLRKVVRSPAKFSSGFLLPWRISLSVKAGVKSDSTPKGVTTVRTARPGSLSDLDCRAGQPALSDCDADQSQLG